MRHLALPCLGALVLRFSWPGVSMGIGSAPALNPAAISNTRVSLGKFLPLSNFIYLHRLSDERLRSMISRVRSLPSYGLTLLLPGKVVLAETTTAHATLTGLHYYHQDWSHAAAYVTVPPLRLDTNTSTYLMSLLAK